MLEIHMIDQDEPLMCLLTIEELMRTAHVIGEVPFVKPRQDVLLNLTAVTRLVEIEESELSTEEARAALEERFGNWEPRPRPMSGPGSSAWLGG